MPNLRRLTALAIARAILSGGQRAAGIQGRLQACLGDPAPWHADLASCCARLPGEHWRRLTSRSLANLIERNDGYLAAWGGSAPPAVRRYFLQEPARMQPLPLGVNGCQVPEWPHSAALARWLGLSTAGLWRLTRPAAWQRRSPLGRQHYRCRLLAKPSGGWRLLEVPEPYLKPLQRRLLDDLLDRVPPHEAACGYSRERSVVQHARAHAGQAVLLKFDLQDFFTSVRASRVHALFATLGYPDGVARELTALCTTATPEPVLQRLHQEGGLTWAQVQRLREPHLPQGAPTSAALANLCAFQLDLRLAGLAESIGARYSRYADDIVLSGNASLHTARERIAAWVGYIAREEGFMLNQRKTRCQRAGRRQAVCNIVVNQHPNLPRPEFDRLKALLHQCATRGPQTQNHEGITDWRGHLLGRIAWARQLNPGKAQRLQQVFDRIVWA